MLKQNMKAKEQNEKQFYINYIDVNSTKADEEYEKESSFWLEIILALVIAVIILGIMGIIGFSLWKTSR